MLSGVRSGLRSLVTIFSLNTVYLIESNHIQTWRDFFTFKTLIAVLIAGVARGTFTLFTEALKAKSQKDVPK